MLKPAPSQLARGVVGAVQSGVRRSSTLVPHLLTSRPKVGGANGTQIFPWPAYKKLFLSTSDGFYNFGNRFEKSLATFEARAGHALGFGWGRNVGLSVMAPPKRFEDWRPQLDFSRKSRNGLSFFTWDNDASQRGFGAQNIVGAMLTTAVSLNRFNILGRLSCEPFAEATLKQASSFHTSATQAIAPAKRASSSANWLVNAWQALWLGAAAESNYALSTPQGIHTTKTLKRGHSTSAEVDFSRFKLLPLPCKLSTTSKKHSELEVRRGGRDARDTYFVQHKKLDYREKRARFSLPLFEEPEVLSKSLGWLFPRFKIKQAVVDGEQSTSNEATPEKNPLTTLLRSVLPNYQVLHSGEQGLSCDYEFNGGLKRNKSWQNLANAWEGSSILGAPLAASEDVETGLRRTHARISRGLGSAAEACLTAVTAEHRTDRKTRLGCNFGFLPFRSGHISPYAEKSDRDGARTRLTPAADAAHQVRHETFREVATDHNWVGRLKSRCEARAKWTSAREQELGHITFSTSWTFNPNNETLIDVRHGAMADVVDRANGLFNLKLQHPSVGHLTGERAIDVKFSLERSQLRMLRDGWAKAALTAEEAASPLDAGQLKALKKRLAAASDDRAIYLALSDYIAEAHYAADKKGEPASASRALATPAAQAIAFLRAVARGQGGTEVRVVHRATTQGPVTQHERAINVLYRYRHQPVTQATNRHELRERILRVLPCIDELSALTTQYNTDPFLTANEKRDLVTRNEVMREKLLDLLRLGHGVQLREQAYTELMALSQLPPSAHAAALQHAAGQDFVGDMPASLPASGTGAAKEAAPTK